MGIGERLKEERERLGLNQTAFAALAGASKNTQYNYEKGERSPDAAYLAAAAQAGVDLLYVVTGERKPQLGESISAQEASLLGYFRQLPHGEQLSLVRTASALAATLER